MAAVVPHPVPPTPPAGPRRRNRSRTAWTAWAAWSISTVAVGAAAILAVYLTVGTTHRPAYRGHVLDTAVLYAHITGGAITATLGPILLSARSRRRGLIRAHRWLGRIYLTASLAGGIGGLYVTRLVERGGRPSQLGLAAGLLAWVVCSAFAYQRIRAGNAAAHRRWAIRSYALTANFLTHSSWVALLTTVDTTFGLPAVHGQQAADWLSWSVNLLLAQLLLSTRAAPPRRPL